MDGTYAYAISNDAKNKLITAAVQELLPGKKSLDLPNITVQHSPTSAEAHVARITLKFLRKNTTFPWQLEL
jgi:hypothetical protein